MWGVGIMWAGPWGCGGPKGGGAGGRKVEEESKNDASLEMRWNMHILVRTSIPPHLLYMYILPTPPYLHPPHTHTHVPPGGPIITGCGCGPPGGPWGGWWGGGGSWPPGGIPGRFIQGGRWGPGSGGLIPWGLLPPVCEWEKYNTSMWCQVQRLYDGRVVRYQLTNYCKITWKHFEMCFNKCL